MVAITEDDIRELAAFRGERAPVTSCYLDVDGAHLVRQQDVQHELDLLLKGARPQIDGADSVLADIQRIEEHVRGGIDRSHTRGLAMFSCTAHDFWRVVELPVRVRSQLVVNQTPYVRQLEAVVEHLETVGLLLADRQRARLFVYELGELSESSELFERLPRGDDDDHSYTKDQGQHHTAALAHQHLRHAADVTFEVFKERGFVHLVLGGPDEVLAELEGLLHPYLQERIGARTSLPVAASEAEVRSAALSALSDIERRKEVEVVDRLREAVGAGSRGVAGLDDTLAALVERRVDTLLVSHGFAEPGWRCGGCGLIARVGRACPACGNDMSQVGDVVEEAVEEAMAQSCTVQICVDNADLDVLGRIGAILRF